ncbi:MULTISPECIES: hypothetical protein [Pontibacillus]|uniref:Uncharacterized protein n=1 Tax=Pontibacillus chungwhensis TaxID=265426 RepID=A0ABY8V0Y5_9BACI|nr:MULTISPECIES: hypothetical protein [Pontibacillus]MCD5322110.1 hypothetical protein [Pontibacillus sp. HN14]WIF99409.1 hypothetical protein QNI29_07050 [Pontibacillus chungwhensis]
MPMWLFLLIIMGALLVLGFVIDMIAKKRKLNIDPEEGVKNVSDSTQVYTETSLDQARHRHDGNNFQ